MGIIGDLIKDIPLSAVIKEKLLSAEAKLAGLETQVDLLEIELSKAKSQIEHLHSENKNLTDQIGGLTQAPDKLHPTAEQILIIISKSQGGLLKDHVLASVQADANEAAYYFDELRASKHVESQYGVRGRSVYYKLGQKGRKYLLDNPTP